MFSAMVNTPWGDSEGLRERRLPPGPGTAADEVERNQRERLYAALIAVVAEKGYERTSVADLVEVSGVSRSAFYERFANKEACFQATVEELVAWFGGTVARNYDGRGTALRVMLAVIASQPAAARICFLDAFAVGGRAAAPIAEAVGGVEAMYASAFARNHPRAGPMPGAMVKAIVGGVLKVVHTRVHREEVEALSGLADELRHWSLGYEPPTQPLRVPRRAKLEARQFAGYTAVERIGRAAAASVVELGYAATSTAEIARRASLSLKTFYSHFANKEEAVVAALELARRQMMALVRPELRRAGNWREGVRALFETLCAFLAAEPAYARLLTIDVYAAGARALDQRDRLIESLQAMLAPGYSENPQTPKIAAEAIGGAIYALLGEQVRSGGAESLPQSAPLATYLTLMPFIGTRQATAVANGEETVLEGESRGAPAASRSPQKVRTQAAKEAPGA